MAERFLLLLIVPQRSTISKLAMILHFGLSGLGGKFELNKFDYEIKTYTKF
jgi:hypothetical protein